MFGWFKQDPAVPDHVRQKLRDLDWPGSWAPIEPAFSDELRREVGQGHVLYGRVAVAVARATNSDDMLFWLPDGPAAFAEVHLTWTGKREWRPEWPITSLFSSFEDWVERSLRADEAAAAVEPRVVDPDDVVLGKDLDASVFSCCTNQDPYPYKCSACELPLVFCRECDTLYPGLPDLTPSTDVNSFDSTKPSHRCPRCGYSFEYPFMKNPAYHITYAEWRASGLGHLLRQE
jgi:hypothetical protein